MMLTAAVGLGHAVDGREAGLQAAHQALNGLGTAAPGLAFLFGSDRYSARDVMNGALSLLGDTPLIGCGLYTGKAGAVTATGIGEEITKTLLSRRVYEKLEQGLNPQPACEWGVSLFPKDIPIGLIAVSSAGYGIAANRPMANYVLRHN